MFLHMSTMYILQIAMTGMSVSHLHPSTAFIIFVDIIGKGHESTDLYCICIVFCSTPLALSKILMY